MAASALSTQSRLAYIDWMRGLACLVMFQTHCYDSWLGGDARKGPFFVWSQVLGTFPAPMFLFLAGVSFAMVTDKLRRKEVPAAQIARQTIWRGGEIFILGILFRLQEYVLGWGWSAWTDVWRVDILNTIGISMMLMGVACWLVLALNRGGRIALGVMATAVGLAISFLTPLLWTTWRPDWLPWPIESYINGVHNLGQPQAWLFPVFPWTGFAFMGLVVGFLLLSDRVRQSPAIWLSLMGAGGIGLIYLTRWIDARAANVYPIYDFWHTSPAFFLIRVGFLLAILCAAYLWCRWGAGLWGFSPLVQLGQTSLLVYWVHIEFVYGRVSILHKHGVDIPTASVGLAIIFVAMAALSLMRTRFKGQGVNIRQWFSKPAGMSQEKVAADLPGPSHIPS